MIPTCCRRPAGRIEHGEARELAPPFGGPSSVRSAGKMPAAHCTTCCRRPAGRFGCRKCARIDCPRSMGLPLFALPARCRQHTAQRVVGVPPADRAGVRTNWRPCSGPFRSICRQDAGSTISSVPSAPQDVASAQIGSRRFQVLPQVVEIGFRESPWSQLAFVADHQRFFQRGGRFFARPHG